MIVIKGASIKTSKLTKVEPILFYIYGAYFYVVSGIVENELRVLKHWKIVENPSNISWLITYDQGVPIPGELGDYLVAHQNNDQAPNETEQTEDQTKD